MTVSLQTSFPAHGLTQSQFEFPTRESNWFLCFSLGENKRLSNSAQNVKTDSVMKQNQRSDLETIQLVLQGEQEQFAKLIERHQSALFYFILKIVKDHDDAEEITQESFLKAFDQLDKFDQNFTFKTWLFTIGRNLAFNFLRKQPRGILSINQKLSEENQIQLEIPDQAESAFERQSGLQFEEAVKKAIANLGPKYAAVFHLKHFEQMDIKQIASAMNLSVSNVKVLLHRARNQIKGELGDWIK